MLSKDKPFNISKRHCIFDYGLRFNVRFSKLEALQYLCESIVSNE